MSDLQPVPGSGNSATAGDTFDSVVVGAGFAGLYALHRLRGLGHSVRVFEAGSDIGGTWFWNRYPGARCDIRSMEYSYQFSTELQQEWMWTERYSTQPEILRYINEVADRFNLRDGIRFNTRIKAAAFDETANRWSIETSTGERVSAQFLIMATGCLSSINMPRIKGLESFRGPWYHTGNWPQEAVDFSGQRVAVIGTGSTAIQAIPLIAAQAAHLYVFQRTANYTIPARNVPLDPAEQQRIKADYGNFRNRNSQQPFGADFDTNPALAMETSPEERRQEYEKRWKQGGFAFLGAFRDLLFDQRANATVIEFVHAKIREIVHDPKTAELLCPAQTFGCKRLCIDNGYYETFNRPNVTLVDVSAAPIEAITATGIRTKGEEFPLDCIVFATGFDAMTGALLNIDIRGKAGQTLKEKWLEGPRTYLGLGVAGFPNLFTITGPGSPSVLANMVPAIEQHVDWIHDCLVYLRERGLHRIEATPEAETDWVAHVNAVADRTLFPSCNSWYLGSNVPGKPRVFMPYLGYPQYVQKCQEVVNNGYQGFALG